MRLLSCAVVAWAGLALVLASGVSVGVIVGLAVLTAGGVAVGLWRHQYVGAMASAALTLVLIAAASTTFIDTRGGVAALGEDHASGAITAVTTGGARKLPADRFTQTARYAIPIRIEHIDARGCSWEVSTPATLIAPESWAHLPWRSHVRTRVRLAPAHGLGQSQVVATTAHAPTQVRTSSVMGALEGMRVRFAQAFTHLPDDPAGLVPALVVGDTAAMPSALNDDMNAAGMAHLNAVSGSNVTIVLVAVLGLLGRTRTPRWLRTCVVLLALLAYVGLCHPEPSVIRAGAMGAVGVLGTSVGRTRAATPALGAAILVLLVWSPWLAVSAGFALSALATLGLILFATPLAQHWTRRAGGRFPKLWEVVAIPVAAQALCLPILVVLASGLSWVSIPANVLAEPLVAPATLTGMVVLLVAQAAAAVAHYLAWIPAVFAWPICLIAHVGAGIPGGVLAWPDGWWGALTAGVLVAIAIFAWPGVRYAGRWGVAAVSSLLLIPAAFLTPLPGVARVPGSWQFVVCDVGQGDALVVRTGPQRAVMVDVGPADARPDRCLDRLGVTRLDAVVLTHFHADHVDALERVIDRTDTVFSTSVTEGAGDVATRGEKGSKPIVDRVLQQTGRTLQTLSADERWQAGDVTFSVLGPRRVIHEGSVQNNASVLLDVSSESMHLLLLGDAEKPSEAAVTSAVRDRARDRPYDVVKVAHHGSSNQSPGLYTAAAARYAAISVGADNDYGHPSRKLLAMADAAHSDVLRTDQCGDIVFLADAAGLRPRDPTCTRE